VVATRALANLENSLVTCDDTKLGLNGRPPRAPTSRRSHQPTTGGSGLSPPGRHPVQFQVTANGTTVN
jgi:hypothetical protein